MDSQSAGGHGFYSLLRHFFQNSNQHLALPVSHGGKTVRHHLPTSTKLGDNVLRWPIRIMDSLWGVQSGGEKPGVDKPWVEKTTMNPVTFELKNQLPSVGIF